MESEDDNKDLRNRSNQIWWQVPVEIGIGNGHPIQYSCLGNSMHRGSWQATVPGVTKELDTNKDTCIPGWIKLVEMSGIIKKCVVLTSACRRP